MAEAPIKVIVSDNDGCLGDFSQFGRPHEEDLTPHIAAFDGIKEYLSPFGVFFSMCTGRSLTNSIKIIHEIGMNAPCALEMGTLVYDPRTDESTVLAYTGGVFGALRAAQDEVRRFRDRVYRYNGELREKIGCDIRFLDDRKNMVCVEVSGKTGYEIEAAMRELFHPELDAEVAAGRALVIPSTGAVDVLPAIGKGAATRYIMRACGVTRDETLAIGDSAHTDLAMAREAGYVACPANADPAMKEYTASRGAKGYVSEKPHVAGVLDILRHASRAWGFYGK